MSKKPILIAHRGNTKGPNPEYENRQDYILGAIEKGFYVEVDVWDHMYNYFYAVRHPGWYLGHDEGKHQVTEKFLQNKKIICHAKDLRTFDKLLENKKIHCFYHTNEDVVLTSRGWPWLFPQKYMANSIIVLPEQDPEHKINNVWDINSDVLGICSDFILNYR